MLRGLRETLQSVLGDIDSWDRLSSQVSREVVIPGAVVRRAGESVSDVLVVEHGLFEVSTPGAPPRWAPAGSIVGLAASLTGAPSQVTVTALRHGRLSRIPARAVWDHGEDVRASMVTVARLAQLPDHGVVTLPPDPLVLTVLFESCDEALAAAITAHLEDAVRALDGGRLVHVSTTPSTAADDRAEELSAHEAGAVNTKS